MKRGRLYLNDGSCIRLRPCWQNHVWAYDFVAERLLDGTKIRFLTVVDEYTRECLALRVAYNLKSDDVMEVLTGLFIEKGIPDHIRSEFTAKPNTGGAETARCQNAVHQNLSFLAQGVRQVLAG